MDNARNGRWSTNLRRGVEMGFLCIVMTIPWNAFAQPGAEEKEERQKQSLPRTASADLRYQRDAYEQSQKQVLSEERKKRLPADLQDKVDTYIDVLYGKVDPEFQTLDAFILKSAIPTPVLIEVHSGGFSRKTKSRAFVFESDGLYMKALRAGISVVSIDYRLSPKYAFPAHAEDVARAIQFIRSKAKDWNIDPTRIASSGGSAGAHLSTWVAFHDDMANPSSEDPVERYSTRLTAVVEWRGPMEFSRLIRNERFITLLAPFFGVPEEDYGKTGESMEKFRFASPITYASSDDPPILLVYNKEGEVDLTTEVPSVIDDPHSFWWGLLLAQTLEAKHVPYELSIAKLQGAAKADIQVNFLKNHLLKEIENPLTAQRATAVDVGDAPATARLAGLVWKVGKNRGKRLGSAEIEKTLDANPHVSGLFLHRDWREVEPVPGAFDWKSLDGAVEAARRKGRFYKLSFKPGTGTPDWVYSEHSDAAAGAAVFETLGPNPHRKDTYQKPVRIPIPWDPVFLDEFERFVAAAGQRYASDPLCAAVAITGANFQSAETHLPKEPKDIERWEAMGYREKLPKAYERYIDIFAKAFPRQQLCLHISTAVRSDDGVMEKAVAYGARRYPDRLTLQNCQLNGKSNNRGLYGYALLQQYAGKLHLGYQSLAYIAEGERGARMGDPRRAVANYVRGRGEYWELWDANGRDPVICKWLLDEIGRARSQAAKTP